MNSNQLQEYLAELSNGVKRYERTGMTKAEEVDATRKFLAKTAPNTHVTINYIQCNYTDIDLVQPVVAQILALYYRGGILREYALQYAPAFIGLYLAAAAKKQHKSVSVLETFFLAVYNEEILDPSPANPYAKKTEEVRVPSIRYPSVYHEPSRLNTVPEIATIRPGGAPGVQSTVRLGPYPTVDRFRAETTYLVLSRILRSVNSSLVYISSDVVSRHVCLCTLAVCLSGFCPPENDLRAKVLDSDASYEVLDDFSKKPRIGVSPSLLLELLTGVYLGLYNGAPELALRALDAAHQRAQFEFLPDVLLVTNAMRNSLLENPLSKERREELMGGRTHPKDKRRKDLVTNSSLRIKKLPDDIPVLETKEKEHSAFGDIVEGMDHLKKKMSALSVHHRLKRKKSEGEEDVELQTISEERTSDKDKEKDEGKASLSPLGSCKEERPRSERGTFSMHAFRHADSAGSTARSVDA